MKNRFTVLLILVCLVAFSGFGEENLIPRRIRIISNPDSLAPITPAILYARLAAATPLVVAGPEDNPHNTIRIDYLETTTLRFVLESRDTVIDTRDYPVSELENAAGSSAVLNEIVEAWSPELGLVKPDVTEELVVRRELLEDQVSFENRLSSPFQATLWLPVAARQSVQTDTNNNSGSSWIWQWPIRADISWYPGENLGITGSFRFEYGNHFSFGSFNSGSGDVATETTNLMLMPGIGIQVRTIGRLSAEFGVSVFFGAVRVTANEPSDKPSLNTGESTWVFFPVLSIEPAIVWSPTDRWSIKARLGGFDLNLAGMDDKKSSYGTEGNSLIMNYFQLGLAYRW